MNDAIKKRVKWLTWVVIPLALITGALTIIDWVIPDLLPDNLFILPLIPFLCFAFYGIGLKDADAISRINHDVNKEEK